jgi:hypothetical protein
MDEKEEFEPVSVKLGKIMNLEDVNGIEYKVRKKKEIEL